MFVMRHDVMINVVFPPDEMGMDPSKLPDGANAVDEQQSSCEATSK